MWRSAAVPLHAAHSPARPDAHRALHRRVHLDGMHGRIGGVSAGEKLRPSMFARDRDARYTSRPLLLRLPLHQTNGTPLERREDRLREPRLICGDVLPHFITDSLWC